MKIGDVCVYGMKSKLKAGEGSEIGKYKFFTSSAVCDKFVNEVQFQTEGIIMGTGGNATLHYCKKDYSVSTDCVVLHSNEKIECKFLYYFFEKNMHILQAGFKGAGLKHTNKSYISNIEINSVPTIQEQKHIIEVLNKAKTIIEKRKEQINELDNLIKAQFVEMFGDPVSNSKGWNTEHLCDIGVLGRGVSKHRPRNAPELLGGKYPLIQTGDVANADLYITEYKSTYSEIGLNQSKMWQKGTLCITIAANIAKTSILSFDACFPDSVVGFVAKIKTNNIFMHYWFGFFQQLLESQAPESAQKNINLQILSNLEVIVPPLNLQTQFATFVQQVDKLKVIKLINIIIVLFNLIILIKMIKLNIDNDNVKYYNLIRSKVSK